MFRSLPLAADRDDGRVDGAVERRVQRQLREDRGQLTGGLLDHVGLALELFDLFMKSLELFGVTALNSFHSIETLFDLRCHRRAYSLHSGGQSLKTGVERGRR
eukprot:5978207-Pyramimonas_sp.AAC.1